MDQESNKSLEPNIELSYRQSIEDDYISGPSLGLGISGLGISWLFNCETLGYDQQSVLSPAPLAVRRQASPILFGSPPQHQEQQYKGRNYATDFEGQLRQVLNLNAVTKTLRSYSCKYGLRLLLG